MKNIYSAFALLIASFLSVSCLEGSFSSNYTTVDSFDYIDFLTTSKDSVFVDGFFIGTSGKFVFNIGTDKEGTKVTGGFGLSSKRDKKLGHRGDKCNEYCVYNSSDKNVTTFAVFHQNDDPTLNPNEGNAIVFVGGVGAVCTPSTCTVANTGMVASMIENGADGFEPFADGDYLTLTLTGYQDKVKGKSVSIDLAKYDGKLTMLNEWKVLDLAPLGNVTSIDVKLETNREGLPLWFCFDNLTTNVVENR